VIQKEKAYLEGLLTGSLKWGILQSRQKNFTETLLVYILRSNLGG